MRSFIPSVNASLARRYFFTATGWLFAALLLFGVSREGWAQRRTDEKSPSASDHIHEANLALKEHRWPDVVEETSRALRNPLKPKLAAQVYLARAMGDYGLHSLPAALADLNEALKSDPTLAEARADRASFEEVDEKWSEAAADRAAVVAAGEANLKGTCALARDYAHAGEKARAQRAYMQATQIPAKSAEDYQYQGLALQALGEEDRAAAAYAMARRLAPSDRDIINAIAWGEATNPSAKFLDGQAAIKDATRACELSHWKDADILDTLAVAYAEAGDFDLACSYGEKALKIEGTGNMRHVMEKHLSDFHKKKPVRDPEL